jgi:hypothetical protein
MAPMAMSLPETTPPVVVVARRRQRGFSPMAIVWIVACVVGAVAGSLAAWQVRLLIGQGPAELWKDLGYLALMANVVILAAAQWLVLRRFRLDAYWWLPATVAANLVTAIVVIPTVLNQFAHSVGIMTAAAAVLSGACALGAAGLVIGTAQAIVLRQSIGKLAWAWIPATALGGALSGALTSALSAQLYGLSAFATLSLVAAFGALLTAASQAPVLVRMRR